MADIVGERGASLVDGETAERRGFEHLAARRDVRGLPHGGRQVLHHESDRGVGGDVAFRRGVPVGRRLNRVNKRVHAGHRGECRRQANCQLRIEQRQVGLKRRAPKPELRFRGVRNHRDAGHLRARAGGRGHADDGDGLLRQRLGGEAEGGDRCVGAEHRGGELAGIERRAAAEADDGSRLRQLAQRPRGLDLRLLRLAGDVRISRDEQTGAQKRLRRALHDAEGLQAGIGDEEDGRARAGKRSDLVTEAGERTRRGDRARTVGNAVKRHGRQCVVAPLSSTSITGSIAISCSCGRWQRMRWPGDGSKIGGGMTSQVPGIM